jgi:hypothetical protein
MAESTKVRPFTVNVPEIGPVYLTVRSPNRQEMENADLEYSLAFNRCLTKGLPTRTRQIKACRESGVWTAEHDTAFERLRLIAVRAQEDLDKLKPGDPGYEFAVEANRVALANYREESRVADQILSHTADSKAYEAQRTFLIAHTIEYATTDPEGNLVNLDKRSRDGKPLRVWPTVESLLEVENPELYARAFYEYTAFAAGTESNWEVDSARFMTTTVDEENADVVQTSTEQVEIPAPSITTPTETSVEVTEADATPVEESAPATVAPVPLSSVS